MSVDLVVDMSVDVAVDLVIDVAVDWRLTWWLQIRCRSVSVKWSVDCCTGRLYVLASTTFSFNRRSFLILFASILAAVVGHERSKIYIRWAFLREPFNIACKSSGFFGCSDCV